MWVNNLLKVIIRVEKVAQSTLEPVNRPSTDPETDTLITQPPRLIRMRRVSREDHERFLLASDTISVFCRMMKIAL